MTTSEFKTIDLILKRLQDEIESAALEEGIDVASNEYTDLVDEAYRRVFERMGISQDDYQAYKEESAPIARKDFFSVVEKTKEISSLIKELQEKRIPSNEEIEATATRIAKQEVKPPVTITRIIKETVVEKPQIIKEFRVEKTIQQEKYDDTPLLEMFAQLDKAIKEKIIPEPADMEKFREELRSEFEISLAKSTNVMDMPNFRKLAMGLQTQIDEVRAIAEQDSGGGVGAWSTCPEAANGSNQVFTVGATAPTDVVSGSLYFEGDDYTFAAGQITFINIQPVNPVRYR
jgi:hypothetical protein